MDLCLIREALARECTEAETAFALQGLGAYPILQSGDRGAEERGSSRRSRTGTPSPRLR